MDTLHLISQIIGIASVAILIFGSAQALVAFIINEIKRFHNKYNVGQLLSIRIQLGQYLLLGLELLIASDIIETLVKPGMEELLQVGAVVLIRTVLSFFLNKEIEAQKKVEE